MLAAALAYEVTIEGADRERAVQLARFALDGDRLWAVDHGLFWVVAAIIRMLADDDLGDFWTRARAEAHSRGSLFAVLSANLWAGGTSFTTTLAYANNVRTVYTWTMLPYVKNYGETFGFYASDGRVLIRFPSPYLRNAPTLVDVEATAELLGISPGTVRSQATRGLAGMREHMGAGSGLGAGR